MRNRPLSAAVQITPSAIRCRKIANCNWENAAIADHLAILAIFPTGAQGMPKSLAKIEKEIEALEREADALRKKDAAGVFVRI